MRTVMLALAMIVSVPAAGSLGACAPTAASIRLNTDKAFLVAQIALKSAQQTALAGIQSGAITGARKAQVLDLLAAAKRYETAAYAASAAGRSAPSDVAALYATLSQLASLGN